MKGIYKLSQDINKVCRHANEHSWVEALLREMRPEGGPPPRRHPSLLLASQVATGSEEHHVIELSYFG